MVTTTKRYTAEDLWQMPNNDFLELWRGEIIELSPAGFRSAATAVRFVVRIGAFVETNDLGVVTAADGGFILIPSGNTVVAPDVAFLKWDRIPGRKITEKFSPVPPDLAIEVTSPYDKPGQMKRKRAFYMEAGVPLVWWADPERQTVLVHRPGRPVESLGIGDVLDGEDVLPGFRLPVADVLAI